MAPPSIPQNGSVLIVRLSALGDVLFALETVASLHAERPDVQIDFLVEDRFAGVLKGHPQLRRVVTVPRRGRRAYLKALRALRRERYDVLLDLHGLLKSSLPVALIRARHKLGFTPPAAREGSHLVVGHRVPLPEPLPHRAARGPFLLRALGLEGERRPAVVPTPEEPADHWPGVEAPRVVLHPGTSAFAAFKRWPHWHHAELARRLVSHGCAVRIGYGPGEEELAASVLDEAPGSEALDGRALGLLGYTDALRQADLVIAADTGPLHLATAAGTTVVALFGPKDASLYGPRGERDATLFHEVPCRPCRRRTCATPQCVLGLPVDEVEREALARLPIGSH